MTDGPDFGALMAQAQALQSQLMAAQSEAAETVVVGQSGGGAVKVTVTGGMDFHSVAIRPDAVDPLDVPMLEDLVLAALHDAMAKVAEVRQGSLGELGDLGGLLG